MTDYETYSLALQVATLVVIVASAGVAILELHLINKQRRAEHEWNRRSTALSYSFSDAPELLRILTRLDFHLQISRKESTEISLEQIKRLSEEDYKELYQDVHFALTRLEYMCVAIRHKVADEDICRDLLENRTISFFRFFRQYIDDVRRRRNSPAIFANLQLYAEKWGGANVPADRSRTDE